MNAKSEVRVDAEPGNTHLAGELREIRPGRILHVATRDAGSDITLFFVHGGGGNKLQWRFQWRHFAALPVNLVAWDAVGHGRSPKPPLAEAYAGAELVADAEAIFAAHRTRRNIVIAHSYGARLVLAWLLAAAARGQDSGIDAVVLLAAAPLGNMSGRRLLPGWLGRLPLPLLELARPILSRAFRRRAWHVGADRSLVDAEQQATRGNSLFMMQALFAGAPAIDEDALGQLTQPVLIVAGEHDGLVPDAASVKLAGLLPHATLQRVQHCGHQIMLEAPEVTNAAIAGVLAGLES
jgi:pimeloyl-ACP methyl ester carboxylesterase